MCFFFEFLFQTLLKWARTHWTSTSEDYVQLQQTGLKFHYHKNSKVFKSTMSLDHVKHQYFYMFRSNFLFYLHNLNNNKMISIKLINSSMGSIQKTEFLFIDSNKFLWLFRYEKKKALTILFRHCYIEKLVIWYA